MAAMAQKAFASSAFAEMSGFVRAPLRNVNGLSQFCEQAVEKVAAEKTTGKAAKPCRSLPPPVLCKPPTLSTPLPSPLPSSVPSPLPSPPSPSDQQARVHPTEGSRCKPPPLSPLLLLSRSPLPEPPPPLCSQFGERFLSRVVDELSVTLSHRSEGARGLLAPKVTASLLEAHSAGELLGMMERPAVLREAVLETTAKLDPASIRSPVLCSPASLPKISSPTTILTDALLTAPPRIATTAIAPIARRPLAL